MRKWITLLFITIFQLNSYSQITFQKLYQVDDSVANLQCYDSKATPDGGYIFTGLASEGLSNVYHPFVMKVNCKGEEEWIRAFGTTQSTSNVSARIIITKDSQFVMINNIGVYSNYNGLVVRFDQQGNVLWQKTLNLSNGNDNINDICETVNGDFVITGSIKDIPDVGLIKLNSNGNLLWSKTFGNLNQYDDGNCVIETNDGGYLITGRYISMGTFNAMLLKTDSVGNLEWLKCYGDTLHHMAGFGVKQSSNGDILMVGSTSILKSNFQSFPDNYIMKLNPIGDTLWTRIFYGTPDEYENASTVQIDSQGNYLIGVATASFPTIGIVPNKFAIAKYDINGNLLQTKIYNNGASQYPRLSATYDGGYLLGGFSTYFSQPVGFRGLLVKMNESLISGCNETDVTNLTVSTSKIFKITQPTPLIGGTGTSIINTNTFSIDIKDSTICEQYPMLQANFIAQSFCLGDTVQFNTNSIGASSYLWDFGNTQTINDTSIISNPTYIYADTGTYQVQLIISNGCESDTQINLIQIIDCDTIPATLPPVLHYATKDCSIIVPNAFSPNGDFLNDILKPIIPINNNKIEFINMDIYNRWGKLVFTSTDINRGWNGSINNNASNVDLYYYMIRYKCGSEMMIQKGDVLLMQ